MVRIAFAVFAGAALIAANVGQAACLYSQPKSVQVKKHRQSDTCVNFGAVPQISAQVVDAEPAPAHKTPTYTEPTPGSYQGFTLGVSKPDPAVRPVPTVGYRWSLQ